MQTWQRKPKVQELLRERILLEEQTVPTSPDQVSGFHKENQGAEMELEENPLTQLVATSETIFLHVGGPPQKRRFIPSVGALRKCSEMPPHPSDTPPSTAHLPFDWAAALALFTVMAVLNHW